MELYHPLTRPITHRASIHILVELSHLVERLQMQPGDRSPSEQAFMDKLNHLCSNLWYAERDQSIARFREDIYDLIAYVEPWVDHYQSTTVDIDVFLQDLYTVTANPVYTLIAWHTTMETHTQDALFDPVDKLMQAYATNKKGVSASYTVFQKTAELDVSYDGYREVFNAARKHLRQYHTALLDYYRQPTLV